MKLDTMLQRSEDISGGNILVFCLHKSLMRPKIPTHNLLMFQIIPRRTTLSNLLQILSATSFGTCGDLGRREILKSSASCSMPILMIVVR